MTLEDQITEAQDFINDPPKNESNTCEWVILPLLWAAGYAKRDIESRVADSAGKYPDYTLLSNHISATYYLEAKAWNVPLEDKHVIQALNYANHNGKRFVVLTNGQDWWLYDNDIRGVIPDKLITQAELRDTSQITDFLAVLSKPAILNNSLQQTAANAHQRRLQENHALQERQKHEEELQRVRQRQLKLRVALNNMLSNKLKNSNSELIVLMVDCLSTHEELHDISPEILSVWFCENLNQPLDGWDKQSAKPDYTQVVYPSGYQQKAGSQWTLSEIQSRPINGKTSTPIAFQSPDGIEIVVSSWVNLAEQLIRWLLQQSYPIPLPFQSTHRTRWFLNRSPEHKSPEQRKKFKEISAHGKTVYMDSDRSGEMFLKDIYALCLAMQVDPNTFKITVRI